MPLLTTSVPNLSQGVSQQPDNLRYPGQGESQVNAYSSVVDGLVKRPNSRYVGTLESASAISADSLVHILNRDSTYRHILVIEPDATTVKVFDTADGSVVNVYDAETGTSAASHAYITDNNPRENLKVLTIADTTYIVNKTKTVAKATAKSDVLAKEAIVFIKQGDYSKEYTVTIDGADKIFTSTATDASSESIATGIVAAIAASPVANVTVSRDGSVIKLVSTNTNFTVSVSDGLSNTGLGMAYKEVTAITDLPKSCYDGFRVKVKGDVELVQDDYYVKFATKDDQAFGEGSWKEDIGYDVEKSLDATTMPIKLIPRVSDTNYKLIAPGHDVSVTNEAAWTERKVGDDDSNDFPSFTGKTITDIFFFKNRLGFLSGQNVIFSEADEYGNFFRTTVLTLLDSAPIDVGVAHTKVSLLKHAIPFQEKLVLFSPQSQFVLRGADLLTPSTVNISPITEYNVNVDVSPLALSNYIYFPFERGDFQGVYEFFVDSTTDVFDASEVTSHIPKYINKTIKQLVGTPAEDVIVATCNATGAEKQIFVYKYFWQNKEKIQSSWSRFDTTNNIIGVGFLDSELFMVTTDASNTYLEKMPMEAGVTDTGKDYSILLDNRVDGTTLTNSYNATSRLTTIDALPYDPANAVVYTKDGVRLATTKVDANTCTVAFDVSDDAFFIGFEYDMEYEFSTQTLKQPTERGGKSTSNFTYQTLRNGAIDYADTGHFKIEVTPLYRDVFTYVYNPSNLGADSKIGSLILDSGSFRFPVHAKHDEVTIKIKSSSALPAQILAAEFESFITPRSQRYGG